MQKTEELTGVHSVDLDRAPTIPANAQDIIATAAAFQVVDDKTKAEAVSMILKSNGVITQVEEFFDEQRELAHRLHKSITTRIAEMTKPFRQVHTILNPKIKQYDARQEALRRAEEQRLQKEADDARLAAELTAKAIQDKADAEAAKLREQGRMKQAEAVKVQARDQAMVTIADADISVATVLPDAPRIAGLGSATKWKGRLIGEHEQEDDASLLLLLKAIANGVIPLRYLTPVRGSDDMQLRLVDIDPTVLNNIAARLRSENIGLPGCEGYKDTANRYSSKSVQVGHPSLGTVADCEVSQDRMTRKIHATGLDTQEGIPDWD